MCCDICVLWLLVLQSAWLEAAVGASDRCMAPLDAGGCDSNVIRFYFNSESGMCQTFTYGGCGGNENNFGGLEECKLACLSVYHDDAAPRFCHLPQRRGLCRTSELRYFYNHKTARCEVFMYGGCLGNANNFRSLQECKSMCRLTGEVSLEDKPPMCYLQSEKGRCSSSLTRYYYDYTMGRCKRFKYTGCFGNDNNFPTAKECMKTCR